MTSSHFRLFFGNFNVTSGSKSATHYTVTDTVGQTAPGQYGMNGSIVKSGFQYLYPFENFSFKISSLSVAFGSLSIGVPATASSSLEVTSVGAGGYTVYAFEDHPMQKELSGAITIPDTLCNTTCSESTVGVWTSTSKYGFGYNMSGNDVPTTFVDNTYFKQFADKSIGETAQVVMSKTGVGTKRSAMVTYKVNIGATQQAGNYQTQIHYIAVPGY